MIDTEKHIKEALEGLSRCIELLNEQVHDHTMEIIALKDEIKAIKNVKVLVKTPIKE